MKKLIPLLTATLLSIGSYAQNQHLVDSLFTVLKTAKEDTNKVNALRALGWELRFNNPDSAIILGNTALRLAEHITLDGTRGWQKGIAKSYQLLGVCCYYKGGYPEALKNYLMALKIYEQLNDKNGIAALLGNFGNLYKNQADNSKALDYYFKALKMDEEIGNKDGIANTLSNIGNVYLYQGDYSKALDYYLRALKMNEEFGNKERIAKNLNNIGTVYGGQADYSKALDYFFKALKINEELENKNGIAKNLFNIGNFYTFQADYSKALDYYLRSVKIFEELGNKEGIANSLGSIGDIYIKTGKFKEAEEYLKKSLAIADSIKALQYTENFEQSLSQLYETTGRPQLALEHYKKHIAARDSIFNDENTKKQTRTEMNYEFDKKESLAKVEQEKKDTIAQKELQKQKLVRNGFVGGFAVVLLFAGVFFSQRNKIKKEKLRAETALDELKKAQQKLVEKEKLAAIGTVAQRMAHEIQNPLNFVNNFSELSEGLTSELTNAKTDEERQEIISTMKENMSKINHHGKRADGIIKNLQRHLNEGKGLELFEN